MISIDETSIDSNICNSRGWSKSGAKITMEKESNRVRYTVVSAISCNKIVHNKIIKGSCNGEIFLEFIK